MIDVLHFNELYYLLVLISPKHVTDSIKTTFKKRELNKRFYLLTMMIVMLTHMMEVNMIQT